MAAFSFLKRAVANNSEDAIAYLQNLVKTNPYQNFTKLYISSPSGCNYFIARLYINGILNKTFVTPSISESQNYIDEDVQLSIAPGDSLQVNIVNLDLTGGTADFEGEFSQKDS